MPLNAFNDPPVSVRERLYFLRFEDLISRHWAVTANPLPLGSAESDSHYWLKYPLPVTAPQPHVLPPRIHQQIHTEYHWYYAQWSRQLLNRRPTQ